MHFRVSLTTTFPCSLERAFKAPMLCDVTKVHTGFLLMPRVTHVADDATWGVPGGSERIFAARSWAFGGGEASIDRVLERVENERWVIEVTDFKTWMLGFTRFVGEWRTREVARGAVRIDYTYTLHAGSPLLAPLQWLFVRVFWRVYMGRVLVNVRRLACSDEPYQYP